MIPANTSQSLNRVYLLVRSQRHILNCMRCPAIFAPGIHQRGMSSESEPEKEPRFRANHSFKTFHGARNQLISGQDYSVLGSNKQTPLGVRERKRLKIQHQLVADVLRLLKELEYAKQRGGLVGAERREDERRQHLMDHKLKSKIHVQMDSSSGQVQENKIHAEGKK